MSRSWVASVAVAVGLVASCGGGAAEQTPIANTPAAKEAAPPPAVPPPAAQDPGDRILGTMRSFKGDVCACTSQACVEVVEKRMVNWAMDHLDELKKIEPTRAQEEEADRLEGQMDACKARIAPASSSSSPPIASSATLTPLPPGGTGSPACDDYVRTFDTIVVTCKDKLGPALDAMIQSRNAQVEAFAEWGALDAASK
ncbi:MAG TPA: hypothetical protein VM261_00060, partial [Kofleriaceae bacterium]|nr:hypothetical protein [Kofleriaceae bacterium]